MENNSKDKKARIISVIALVLAIASLLMSSFSFASKVALRREIGKRMDFVLQMDGYPPLDPRNLDPNLRFWDE